MTSHACWAPSPCSAWPSFGPLLTPLPLRTGLTCTTSRCTTLDN
jgi:hypothetical protein